MQDIKVQYNKQVLSQEQENFNLLLEQIEKLSEAIANRKALNETFNQVRNKELIPVIQRIKALKIKQIKMLGHLFNTRDFSKAEFRRIREEIIAQIESVLNQFQFGSEDEDELFAVLSFHRGVSKDFTKSRYQRIEIELDEEKVNEAKSEIPKSPEEIKIESIEKKSLEKMLQSIRSIYIPLVKKLHPDRELDEKEKIRKTEILQKLTGAYEKRDLIALLMLQSEYQLNQNNSDNLKDIKAYNVILQEQAQQLEKEYAALYEVLGNESIINEKTLKKLIKSRKKALNQYYNEQEELLVFVYSDVENLIQYLK